MPERVALAGVAGVEPVSPGLWLVHLEAPEISPQLRPGHCLLVRCTDPDYPALDPYLPRAYFVFAADRQAGRLSLLVEIRGRGSSWLAGRRTGDRVLVHGPIGRELRLARLTRHLLLLAEGAVAVAGTALLAAEAARAGLAVTLVASAAATRGDVPPQLLPAAVEYRIATAEGGGLLGVLPSVLSWADEVVVAAPWSLLETMATLRRAGHAPFTLRASLPVQAMPLPAFPPPGGLAAWGLDASTSAPAPGGGDALPCGTGACGACAVLTGRGARLFCREGPAFPLEDLRFVDEADEADEADELPSSPAG